MTVVPGYPFSSKHIELDNLSSYSGRCCDVATTRQNRSLAFHVFIIDLRRGTRCGLHGNVGPRAKARKRVRERKTETVTESKRAMVRNGDAARCGG